MSLSSQTARSGPFVITGSPQVIPVVFPFQQASDLLVLNYGPALGSNDPATELVFNSDYTVSGGGYNAANEMLPGSITVVSTGVNSVATGDNIVIIRNAPLNQTDSFLATGPLTVSLLEQALDKMATLSQQVNDLANRSLHFENFENLNGLLSLNARAGFLLGFDDQGNISFTDETGGGGGTVYTAGPGLLLSSNQFSVNPDLSLNSLVVTNAIVGAITGNANSATQLLNARTINGVSFDGTQNITVTAAALTLTGTTLNPLITTAAGLSTVAVGTLGTMAIQNANLVAITGGTITGMPSPTNGSDVATKTYVDNLSTGIVQRAGVQVATTANISLSGEQTIDGVLTSSSRILVKNQSAPAQNGIYVTAAGAWSRATDSDTAAELKVGYYYFVSLGTTQGATGWTIQTAPTILNTDPVVFGQFSASTTYTAGTGISLVGNVFSNSGVLSVAGTSNEITASASTGALTLALATLLTFTGKTITGGTFNATSLNGPLGGGTPNTIAATTASVTVLTATPGAVAYGILENINSATTSAQRVVDSNTGGRTWYHGPGISGAPVTDWCIFDSTVPAFALRVNSTGINSTPIGASTPSTVKGTIFDTSSNANRIASKGNFNLTQIDIRDYGATTASSDNTTAINAAITAATTGQAILIPEGTWQYQGTLAVTGKTGLTIQGTGMGSILSKTANFSNTGLNVGSGTTNFTLFNVSMNTTTSSRLGGHLVVLNGDGNRLLACRFANASEFTVFAGNSASDISTNVVIDNCQVLGGKADGFHFGAVRNGIISNCLVRDTGDDAIAVGGDVNSNASYYSDGVLISNCKVLTSASRGILLEDCKNVTVVGCDINDTVSAGIWSSTYQSTTWFNTGITIKGCRLYNVTNSSGTGRAGILAAYTTGLTISDTYIYNTTGSTLSSVFLCDCSQVSVNGNQFWNTGVHGVVGYNSTTTGPSDFGPAGRTFSANWNDWNVSDNDFNGTQNAGGIAVYLLAPSTATVQRPLAINNKAANWQGGSYIAYARCTTGKILLNTSLEGKSVTDAGGNTSVTATPNY